MAMEKIMKSALHTIAPAMMLAMALLLSMNLIADVSGNDMIASSSSSNPPGTIEIQQPDFFDIGIEYNSSIRDGSLREAILGKLIEIVGQPIFRIEGPATFTDGSIATQTVLIDFLGVWELKGNLHRNDTVYLREGIITDRAFLKFGLTEDNGDGAKWRIMDGAVPNATIDPGHPQGDLQVIHTGFGLCMWAALNGISYELFNDLNYLEENQDENSYGRMHQTLSTSDCTSIYPNFILHSNYGYSARLGDLEEQENYTLIITLTSGINVE